MSFETITLTPYPDPHNDPDLDELLRDLPECPSDDKDTDTKKSSQNGSDTVDLTKPEHLTTFSGNTRNPTAVAVVPDSVRGGTCLPNTRSATSKAVNHATSTSTSIFASSTAYEFPISARQPNDARSFEELKIQLQAVIKEGFRGTEPSDYAKVRDRFCELSIALNRLASWAPAFRGIEGITFEKEDEQSVLFARDCQVIDLHWIWSRDPNHHVSLLEYDPLFSASEFDFTFASKCASDRYAWATKVAYLNIDEDLQWELFVFKSREIRKKWKILHRGDLCGGNIRQDGIRQIDAKLKPLMRQRSLISDWLNVWLAARISGESWAKSVRLLSLMTGERQRDVKQFKRTYQSIQEKLKTAKGKLKT